MINADCMISVRKDEQGAGPAPGRAGGGRRAAGGPAGPPRPVAHSPRARPPASPHVGPAPTSAAGPPSGVVRAGPPARPPERAAARDPRAAERGLLAAAALLAMAVRSASRVGDRLAVARRA